MNELKRSTCCGLAFLTALLVVSLFEIQTPREEKKPGIEHIPKALKYAKHPPPKLEGGQQAEIDGKEVKKHK